MPRAAASDPAAPPTASFRAEVWRAVESQHLISTMRLTDDDPADQRILEQILEAAKPPLPASAKHLHWLHATPFRYAPRIGGSRFRARGDPGVYYAARELRTACAEAGYWKWRFVRDSAGLRRLDAHPMTLFPAQVRGSAWDLTRAPLAARRKAWTHATDYTATQTLARRARGAGIQVVEYESVRDPARGHCAAVLDVRAIEGPADPLPRAQSWFLAVRGSGVVWMRETRETLQFDFGAFA